MTNYITYIPNHGVPGQINQAAWYYENWAPNDKLSLLARILTVRTIETLEKKDTRNILKHSSISKDQQRRLVVSACYGLIRIPASGIGHIYKNKSNGLANKLTEVVKELRRLI